MVELIIASVIGSMVLLAMGVIYTATESSFRVGARKLAAQQEATFLSGTVARLARRGDTFRIYRLPDRITPADSGDGLAVFEEGGALIGRLEWDSELQTLVDNAGNRVNAMKVTGVLFQRDPARPREVRYRFATDDEKGNLVEFESSASHRN